MNISNFQNFKILRSFWEFMPHPVHRDLTENSQGGDIMGFEVPAKNTSWLFVTFKISNNKKTFSTPSHPNLKGDKHIIILCVLCVCVCVFRYMDTYI